MKTKVDKNFKQQFKLSFIKSIKSGFNIEDIKKNLKKQSYPSDLINKLINELQSDREIIRLTQKPTKLPEIQEPKKPSFFQNIKDKLFKLGEAAKIQRVIKIHSIYYNLIINKKTNLSEEYIFIDDILNNLENKKLIANFIRAKQSYTNKILKFIHKIRNLAKTLMGQELQQEYKNKVNQILEFIESEETNLDNEKQILKQLKQSINTPEELKKLLQKEKFQLKRKENSLQTTIKEISRKSEKFREAISQL